jgi:hypothetical protein
MKESEPDLPAGRIAFFTRMQLEIEVHGPSWYK